MIVVVMNEHGLDLQSAVDFVGEMCRKPSIDSLKPWDVTNLEPRNRQAGQDLCQVVGNWIVGSLHWPLIRSDIFGKERARGKGHEKLLRSETVYDLLYHWYVSFLSKSSFTEYFPRLLAYAFFMFM